MPQRPSTRLAAAALITLAALLAAGSAHLGAQPRPADSRPAPPGGWSPLPDTMAARRDSLMNLVLRRIAGRESAPAESVFENIQVLKGIPAGRIPRMMNMGFGRSLGVGCDFCHDPRDFARDDHKHLRIARDMIRMTQTINGELGTIAGLDQPGGQTATVNCGTCHRGSAHVMPRLARADTARAR